ncbi:MAG: tRNA (adenosine(37)-N6)-threonylcarbamoyltransferase complex ATPase subunit type 1 TsaE [Bacillota bacterium]|nr:tRNA (adenosine(37)-N6)-threonylcarbamoyltransferase complex ATPase subunit type 1 TsaE [Bacillota bacterium]MDW7683643.1 tRNA (adenosine(37)-N6)-threonylcarbamoyltransferase complex ATPase subunit type 1 TsaE [Bacillota bacterium]
MERTIETCSEQETEALGAQLGERLFAGAVVLLEGELGAGKTVFARGVGRGLGVETPIQSPTFTILNAHQGRLPYYHFDLYRLDAEEELYELGMDEYLDGEGVSLVEWAGRFAGFFSLAALQVRITGEEGACRQITFLADAEIYQKIIDDLSLGR